MFKRAIVKRNFTGSVDGINLKDYLPGDEIYGPIEKINEWLSNGWLELEKKAKEVHENKMIDNLAEKQPGVHRGIPKSKKGK